MVSIHPTQSGLKKIIIEMPGNEADYANILKALAGTFRLANQLSHDELAGLSSLMAALLPNENQLNVNEQTNYPTAA